MAGAVEPGRVACLPQQHKQHPLSRSKICAETAQNSNRPEGFTSKLSSFMLGQLESSRGFLIRLRCA